MKLLATLLAATLLAGIHNTAFAADDKSIQNQRREAQKERQAQKNERAAEIRDASKLFRDYARDIYKQLPNLSLYGLVFITVSP